MLLLNKYTRTLLKLLAILLLGYAAWLNFNSMML